MSLNAKYFFLIQKIIGPRDIFLIEMLLVKTKFSGLGKLVLFKAQVKDPRTDLECLVLEWKPLWLRLNSPPCSDSSCIWNNGRNNQSAELGTPCAEVPRNRSMPQISFGLVL